MAALEQERSILAAGRGFAEGDSVVDAEWGIALEIDILVLAVVK